MRLHPKIAQPLQSWVLIGVLIMVGLAFSAWLYTYLYERHKTTLQNEFQLLSQQRLQILETHNARSLEALYGLVSFLAVPENRTLIRFKHFVKGSLSRLPELQALEWIPYVEGTDREAFEARARAQGLSQYAIKALDEQGKLVTAGEKSHYYPVLYAYPKNINKEAIGLDLTSQPDRLAAIESTLQSRDIVASAPVRLAQEKDDEVYGILIFAPVFNSDSEGAEVVGFALAVYRSVDLFGAVFGDLADVGVEVKVFDRERPHLVLYSNKDDEYSGTAISAGQSPIFESALVFELGRRDWQIEFAGNDRYGAAQHNGFFVVYPLGILLILLLYSFYTINRIRYIQLIEKQVETRTRDLTEEVKSRRSAELAAQLAERRYRSIVENSIDGIFQSTPEGQYITANSALAHIYGYDSVNVFINSVKNIESQLYVDPNRRKVFMQRMRDEGRVSNFVSEVYKRDGTIISILEKAISVYSEHGELLYYEGNVQDVTDRVLAERALQKNTEWLEAKVKERTSELATINLELKEEVKARIEAEQSATAASAAKTQFLAGMSHEIRTPLNAIIGYSQILQQDANLSERYPSAINSILQSGNHLLSLIDDILDLSKIEAGHLTVQNGVFDLASCLTNIAYIVQRKCDEKALKLKIEGLGSRPVWVRGDEVKLRQVLINLLNNAVKYTESGEVLLRVVPLDDDLYRFEVIDTGPGIPEQDIHRIFNQFYQRSSWKEGNGLGLSISSRIVKALGSNLRVQSKVGVGSNFFFSLQFPSVQKWDDATDTIMPLNYRLQDGRSFLVLVVDDVQHNRDILKLMLESLGCQVISAGTGAEALDYLQLQTVDIVFMDILMPEKDGIETRSEIVAGIPGFSAPIVAFSASAHENQGEQLKKVGFDDVITKPFRMEQLVACLVRLLGAQLSVSEPELNKMEENNFSEISIPPDLAKKLISAAQLYNMTRLRDALAELSQCSTAHTAFVNQCRELSGQHKIAELIALVERYSNRLSASAGQLL